MYFYHPHTGRFEQSTRSFLRPGFAITTKSLDDDVLYTPYRVYRTHGYGGYDTTGEENYTRSAVNRELMSSTAAMEDSFDISARSRNRDREVLAAASRAIVDSGLHTSPRSAVATRRAVRGRSMPPAYVSTPVQRVITTEVHLGLARDSPKHNYPVPPASPQPTRARFPRVTVKPRYKYSVPIRTVRYVKTKHTLEPSPELQKEGLRRAPLSNTAYLRNHLYAQKGKRYKSRATVVPKRSASKKAALLGSKVDIVRPNRRPRSAYAKAHVKKIEQRKEQAASEAPVSAPEETVEHRMYKPVSKHPQLLKPIRCVDGIKSPNPNIMSWKHRIDAYTSPDDIVMVPRSLNSVRASVLEVQDKLDRHKQLMDRYLVTDTGLSADDRRVLEASKAYLATRA